jgi:CRISPR-associated exonuclease Cas4
MNQPWWPGQDRHASRIPISALEHFAYCPRQAALIHIDGVFTDDVNTVLGNLAHHQVHKPGVRHVATPGARIITGMPVYSDRLGLYGICDAVELTSSTAVPIEHKVGRHVPGGPGEHQAIAQALCLREMLDHDVPHTAIFSHADRRRHIIALTNEVVTNVEHSIEHLRLVLRGDGHLPPAVNDNRCRRCSLRDDCLPELTFRGAALNDPYSPRPLGDWDGGDHREHPICHNARNEPAPRHRRGTYLSPG